ncbi:MAG: hypothetical protein OXF79_25730 [Chloroflexi bacterium]|nr:hypothetical protein [Chloroflexota bacterium]
MHFAVDNLPNLVEEQAKKRIALTVCPVRIEKTSEYARQVGFSFVKEVEQGKSGRGPPVKLGLRSLGYTHSRSETGEESLQIGFVGPRGEVHLDREAVEKSRQLDRVARHIPFRDDHHANRQCDEILGGDYTQKLAVGRASTSQKPDNPGEGAH